MKKTLKLSAVTLTLVLTACGSGGGSGSATTPDGDKINLDLSPKGTTVTAATTYGRLTGQNNLNSFYGVWQHNSGGTYQLRYQGTEATNIPTSGRATYIGDAIWIGSSGSYRQGGETRLNVDFGNKTVDGKIAFSLFSDGRSQDITLHQGRLEGANFSGSASTLLRSDGSYKGALFGRGATEAAGLVEFGDASYNAAFGGKR